MTVPMTVAGAATLVLALLLLSLAFAWLWARQKRRADRLQDRLDDNRQRALDAERAADAFFDLVGHELRSPIAAIIGYQELLGDGVYGDVGARARDPLERIGRSTRYLLDLVDGTLDLARIRAGALSPDLETADLDLLIEEIASDFRSYAAERDLRHYVRIEHPLPTIRSDHVRLARALRLLAISAARHASDDGLELRVHRHHDGATVHISGAAIPLNPGTDDPAVRAGIRIAIAIATANLLGDDLELIPPNADTVAEIAVRIRDTRAAL